MQFSEFMRNEHGDHYLYEVNKAAFCQIGAEEFYREHFSRYFDSDDAFYIIVGTDSGLLPLYLSQQVASVKKRILFVEIPEVLEQVDRLDAFKTIKSQFTFAKPNNWYEKAKNMQIAAHMALDKVVIINSVAAIDDHLGCYHTLHQTIEETIIQATWKERLNFCGNVFTNVQLKNIGENHTPALVLQDIADDKTGVLLAGGPSLDDNLDFIREHREQLFLVAVSRISERLQQVGITPDIIVCIDPTEKMFTVSKAALNFDPVPILVQAYSATPLLTGVWPGKQLYLGKRVPWESSLNDTNIATNGPTVTNAALLFMITMGFRKIFFCGVDLSYSLDGFTHAKGSAEYNAGPRLDHIGHRVPLNDETLGETDSAFSHAVAMLEEQAAYATEQSCLLFNTSFKAAKIKGVIYKPLSDIDLKQDAAELKQLVHDKLSPINGAYITAYYQRALKDLQDTKARIFQFKQSVKQALETHKKASINSQNKSKRLLEKINQDHFKVLQAIKLHGYRYLEEVFKFQGGQQTAMDSYNAIDACLGAYDKSAAELFVILREAIDRLQIRQQEILPKANHAAILKQWQLDRHYHRANLWLRLHESELNPENLQRYQAFAEKAEAFLPESKEKTFLVWNNICYQKAVLKKLEHLYKLNDTERLRITIGHLAAQTHEDAQVCHQYAKGLLAELTQDIDSAINYFHASAKGEAMEISLNHLTVLLLKKHDINNALNALECLVQLSPGYQTQYQQLQQLVE